MQLFIIFYGLPSVGIVFTPFVSAILGLTISQGAYNSEVIRGAIAGIQKGQYEAPKSLGMTKGQTLIHVILPQAALTAVPALANSFISLLKDPDLALKILILNLLFKPLHTFWSFNIRD